MAATAKKKSQAKGLGRGLDALLGDAPSARRPDPAPAGPAREDGPRRDLPIEFLKANPNQPRRTFDDEAIAELARSIKARGLLQPILVRPHTEKEFEIVAGERRWRAAQQAKLHKVPVIIRELTDEEAAEIALIENVQRVDLNPIEEAAAYNRLADEYGRTQDEIAKAVGKSRSHVANIMRLSGLPEAARDALLAGDITMGHARALLGAKDPKALLQTVLKRALSVRETEALARMPDGDGSAKSETKSAKPSAGGGSKDADTRALERDLGAILGLEVTIAHQRKGAGVISIEYFNLDQLDDLCRRLMGSGV